MMWLPQRNMYRSSSAKYSPPDSPGRVEGDMGSAGRLRADNRSEEAYERGCSRTRSKEKSGLRQVATSKPKEGEATDLKTK